MYLKLNPPKKDKKVHKLTHHHTNSPKERYLKKGRIGQDSDKEAIWEKTKRTSKKSEMQFAKQHPI